MSYLYPRTLAELERAIGSYWNFGSRQFNLQGNTSHVLSSAKHITPGEAFADKVIADQEAYTARYMTNGDRFRKPEEVLYYLTSGSHVVAYVTAGGEYAINNELFTPQRLRVVAKGITHASKRAGIVFGDELEQPRISNPALDALRYHVSGAIARGEAQPIYAVTN